MSVQRLSKQDAIQIMACAANIYKEKMSNKDLLVVYGDTRRNSLSYLELSAKDYNFLHLTGVTLSNANIRANNFINSLSNIQPQDFNFRDGTTHLKLEILSDVVNPSKTFRAVGDYNNGHPLIKADVMIGGKKCCMGLVEAKNGKYMPSTALKSDVNKEIKNTEKTTRIKEGKQIFAMMQKESCDKEYRTISYLANNMYAHKLFRDLCEKCPEVPIVLKDINYETLLPIQQMKEEMFFSLERKEEQKKEVETILESIADSREKAIVDNDENALEQYYNLQDSLHEKIQQANLFDFAKEILEKQQSKTSNDDIASEIQTEISQIDKLKLEYETKGRTATVSFSIHGKNDTNTPKFATSNGEYVATATRQITFDIPIPPRKPLKALYIKMRDVVHSIADKFKSKPDNKSSGSGNGSSISKPQTDNNQSKDKKPEQKQDISQTIPSQPSVQTDIPNNSLSEEDKAVRTIIEQATGKKAEEMSPQLFEQLFEQVKELYQENIVNQAKPQHKSEPAPKATEPKEEPAEHSLTAEKDSYEIDL